MKFWNRNYTLVVIGQIISLVANNILHFALSLYILDLTGSGVMFGTITAVSMLPVVLLMPFGGMLADRVNRKKIMVAMDLFTGFIILLAYLPLFGSAPLPAIAALLIVLSVIEAFYTPCVQASIPVLQEPDNLVKANALVNQIGMAANIVGAILGGILYGFLGIKPIVLFSVIFFIASAIMELFIVIPHIKPESSAKGFLGIVKADFKESIRFVTTEQRNILKLIPTIAVINFSVSAMLTVGTPYILRVLLGMSSEFYGFGMGLISAAGILGGIIAVLLSKKLKMKSLYKVLFLIGVSLIPVGAGFLLVSNHFMLYVITTVCLMIGESCASIFSVFVVSAIELKTPPHLLGKIMALVTTVSICAEPLGRAVYGILFDVFRNHVSILLLATAIFTMVISFTAKRPLTEMGGSR